MQIINHSEMKLGKAQPLADSRTLSLGNYINSNVLPSAPAECSYSGNISDKLWGCMGNDKIPDCTCAAAGHLIMAWTEANKSPLVPTDEQIVTAYAAITGYNPATGTGGTEAAVKPVLDYWRNTGIASHKIMAYTSLNIKDHTHLMQAVYIFGGCYAGLALPLSAQTQLIWDIPPKDSPLNGTKGSWGGHVVPVIGYDNNGLTIVTWGAIKKMTWQFWDAYCDEAYALISTDFAGSEPAPNGFDLAALQKDLKMITAA